MKKYLSLIAAAVTVALALRLMADAAGAQAAMALVLLGAFAALYVARTPAPRRAARPAQERESRLGELLGARATTAFGDL